jgi:translation initiation factor IF-2
LQFKPPGSTVTRAAAVRGSASGGGARGGALARPGAGGDAGFFRRRKRLGFGGARGARQRLTVVIKDGITLRQLAIQLRVKSWSLAGKFAAAGEAVGSWADAVDGDVAELICADMGARVRRVTNALRDRVRTRPPAADELRAAGAALRAPVISVMGHVDHGKTSLLDALRGARVAAGEAGGITQSLAAFSVAMKAAAVATGAMRAPGGKAGRAQTSAPADDGGAGGGEAPQAGGGRGRLRGVKARADSKRAEAAAARKVAAQRAATAAAEQRAAGAPAPPAPADVMTFIDTPGHALFSAMRAHGSLVTDIVVLVVDGRDGVMPQTRECVRLILASGARAVVAVTKCDTVDPASAAARTAEALLVEGLVVEAYGGDVPVVPVSARTGFGLDDLKETIALLAEMGELRARADAPGEAVVMDSRPVQGQGQTVDAIVRWGTLRVGDVVVAAHEMGRVKALLTDAVAAGSLARRLSAAGKGGSGGGAKTAAGGGAGADAAAATVFKPTPVREALPGTPVRILGLRGAPAAGEDLLVVPSEEAGKAVLEGRARRAAAKAALAVAATDAVIRDAARNEYKLKRTRRVALTLATQRARSRAALQKTGVPIPERLVEQPWETAILAECRAGGVAGMSASGRKQRTQGAQQSDAALSFAAVSSAIDGGDGVGVTAAALASAQAVPSVAFALKADSTGALAALAAAFERIASADARLAPRVVASSLGDFSEKDVEYAAEFKAHLVGFGAKIPAAVQKVADRKAVKVRASRVIYHVLDEVLDLLADYLPAETVETVAAVADVKTTFSLRGKRDDVSKVAGCAIAEGTFTKSAALYRVLRDGAVVHEAKAVSSLQQFKDRVETVAKGKECGIGLDGFEDFAAGDKIVAVALAKKKPKLTLNWD